MGYEGIEVEVTPGPGPTETPPSLSSLLWSRTIRALEARGVILVLSFTLSIVVARTLSPAGRGHFALLQALNGLTAVTVNFAVSSAALYHIGKGSLSPERAGGAASALAALSGALGAMVLIPIALLLKGSIFAGIPTLFVVGAILLATPLLLRDYLGGVM